MLVYLFDMKETELLRNQLKPMKDLNAVLSQKVAVD